MKRMILTLMLALLALPASAHAFSSDPPSDQNQTVLLITINQPKNTTLTNNTPILNTSMNLVGDILYSVDDTTNETGCNNCSGFEIELALLSDGTHHVTVYGNSSGIENSSTVYFMIDTTGPGIAIISPINTTYNSLIIGLNITTDEIVDTLSYYLDGSYGFLCNSCDGNSTELNVSEGSHYLIVYANDSFGNENSLDVYFSVDITGPVITVDSPTNSTYDTDSVDLNVTTDQIVDTLWYRLDEGNDTILCTSCDSNETILTSLTDGSHHLVVYAIDTLGNEEHTDVYFSVNTTIPTPTTTTTIPPERPAWNFTLGFQHLPKMYAAGDVSNEELISILENNKLNPGILNRLIKTGRLSMEAITTMLDTQFLPPGMLIKILWYFGHGHNYLIENIFNYYNLTDEQLLVLFSKHKIPPGTLKRITMSRPLTEEQIDLLLETQEFRPSLFSWALRRNDKLEALIEKQTLTEKNLNTLLRTQKTSPGLLKKIVASQLLSQENIDFVINTTIENKTKINHGVVKSLIENQDLSEEQMEELIESLPKGLQKKYNVTISPVVGGRGHVVGRQAGRGEKIPTGSVVEIIKPKKPKKNIGKCPKC